MSILIKGMEMPKSCYNCHLRYFDGEDDVCIFGGEIMHGEERCDDCPLVPVLPHGRLIDADLLCKVLKKKADDEWNKQAAPFSWSYAYECEADAVEDMPTIIPAEEGER